ncbi:MAG: AAA family ATPase [Saprospiraceae bacterium]
MRKINYPLLYYPLQEGAVLGLLVGTDLKLVEKDLGSVVQALKNELQRNYKKFDDYPDLELDNAFLRIVKIKVRPAYKEDSSVFTVSEEVTVPVPIIFGETIYGYFECHIPTFNSSFIYYEKDQLNTLAKYAILRGLDQMEPPEIYSMMRYPEPKMDFVTLRVDEDKALNWGDWDWEPGIPTIERLTEPFPLPKAVRKNLSGTPDTAWELDLEVERATALLIEQEANLLLIGNHGAGKSSVLKSAIKKAMDWSKKHNRAMTFWRILAQRITSTSKYLGEWQENLEKLIAELRLVQGVLWVEDIIRLLQSGGSSVQDSIAAYLVPFLRENKIRIIGEVTPKEWDVIQQRLPAFASLFQTLRLEDMPADKVNRVMEKFADYSRQAHKVDISQDAIQLAYRLLARYYPYESFPGKAIQFLGKCVTEANNKAQTRIGEELVIQTFTGQTGLPELFLRDDKLLDQNELRTFFNERILGQPGPIEKLIEIVKIYKAGLNNPHKPITTLLFAGPTGVGKTASAKALADYFFGKGQKDSPLIRIDMSEFQHPWQLGRLLGEGNQPGQLISEVRSKPFAVVLLDEIEKASPVIFDALLTLLDEGIMVDSFGRPTNFRNTIIILTSNLGAANRRSIGFGGSTGDEAMYQSAIGRFFRPEFVNRIDNILIFNSLNENVVRQIALKELKALETREGFEKKKIKLSFQDNLVEYLVKKGFDDRYGARPLQRTIEQEIVFKLANWMLLHPEVENTTLVLSYEAGLQIKV